MCARVSGRDGWIRTSGFQVPGRGVYQADLHPESANLVHAAGFEPAASGLSVRCSSRYELGMLNGQDGRTCTCGFRVPSSAVCC